MIKTLILLAGMLITGIETAYVPSEDGGGDYLVRVEPDLVREASPYTFTSDVPADSQNVRRVKIYVADAWPPSVQREVRDAAKRPRVIPAVATAPVTVAEAVSSSETKPWPLLIGSLITLFVSIGANGYLCLVLVTMRSRYVQQIQSRVG
jgi:hypothetical protein